MPSTTGMKKKQPCFSLRDDAIVQKTLENPLVAIILMESIFETVSCTALRMSCTMHGDENVLYDARRRECLVRCTALRKVESAVHGDEKPTRYTAPCSPLNITVGKDVSYVRKAWTNQHMNNT